MKREWCPLPDAQTKEQKKMLEISDIKRELKKIREVVSGRSGKDEKSVAKAHSMFNRLRLKVMEDISKTGDQRTRAMMKILSDFKL